MNKTKALVLKIRAQHSCFCYEESNVVVTVYSPRKKNLTKAEINWYLDAAKDNLLDRQNP